jgi:hypothetical protein
MNAALQSPIHGASDPAYFFMYRSSKLSQNHLDVS